MVGCSSDVVQTLLDGLSGFNFSMEIAWESQYWRLGVRPTACDIGLSVAALK